MSSESEMLQMAMNAGKWPGIFVSAGLFIWLSCRGIAQVILARQGKSTGPPPSVPSRPISSLQTILLAAALAAALAPLLR